MAEKRFRSLRLSVKLALATILTCITISIATAPELNACYRPYKTDIPKYTKKELECLALNAYHEARGESFYGMQLVTKVVLNRVKHNAWPNQICNVVYQPYQFSWTHQNPRAPKTSTHEWKKAVAAAKTAYLLPTKATFYHANYVKPAWASKFTKIEVYKQHIFYSHL